MQRGGLFVDERVAQESAGAKVGYGPSQVWGQKLGQALLIWVGTLSA